MVAGTPTIRGRRREQAALEIALVLGPTALLRTEDWVARQTSELLALRARVTASEGLHTRGEFLGHRLGGRPRGGERERERAVQRLR